MNSAGGPQQPQGAETLHSETRWRRRRRQAAGPRVWPVGCGDPAGVGRAASAQGGRAGRAAEAGPDCRSSAGGSHVRGPHRPRWASGRDPGRGLPGRAPGQECRPLAKRAAARRSGGAPRSLGARSGSQHRAAGRSGGRGPLVAGSAVRRWDAPRGAGFPPGSFPRDAPGGRRPLTGKSARHDPASGASPRASRGRRLSLPLAASPARPPAAAWLWRGGSGTSP